MGKSKELFNKVQEEEENRKMENPREDIFKRVYDFNNNRGLLENFNPTQDLSYLLEELIEVTGKHEAFNNADSVEILLDNMNDFTETVYSALTLNRLKGKELFRFFCREFIKMLVESKELNPEEIQDGIGDMIYFGIGTMYKNTKINKVASPKEALLRISNANDLKSNKLSKEGKVIKGDKFISPDMSK